METWKKILIALAFLLLVTFTISTGVFLFGVETNVLCFADDGGTIVDVAYRFNNTLIILFSA